MGSKIIVSIIVIFSVMIVISMMSDFDHDNLINWIEIGIYKTHPLSADSDGDGLTDGFEVKEDLDPLNPNPIYKYLKDINHIELYEIFKPLESGGMTKNEKTIIDEYVLHYKENPNIQNLLMKLMDDNIIEDDEVDLFKDPSIQYCLFKNLTVDEAIQFKNIEFNDDFKLLINLLSSLKNEERKEEKLREFIGSMLFDGKITKDECVLFNDKFIMRNPPSITIKWEPTKIILDKIYDIEINIDVIDKETSVNYVELQFIPINYTYFITKYGVKETDYFKIFPKENKRIYVLKSGGAFDKNKETFKIQIENITGGREYLIRVIAKDKANNTKIEEIKTSYIRQYENIGKLLYMKGYIIGATYYVLYPKPVPWKALEPMLVHPLMGKYNVCDPIVMAKHIDWASGFGINCFFISWGYDDEIVNAMEHQNIIKFTSSNYSREILISILYEISRFPYLGVVIDKEGNIHLNDSNKWKMVIEDFKILDKSFFRETNFLKVENKSLVYIYDSGALCDNVSQFIKELKWELNGSIFLVSDHAHPWSATSSYIVDESGGWIEECDPSEGCKVLYYANLFDGWSVWAAGWFSPVVEPLNEYYPLFLDEGYKVWNKLARKYNKTFIPSVIPGFVDLRNPNFPRLSRDVEMFKKELIAALETAISRGNMRIIRIDTFNEFSEATGIEPTREEGFAFLKTLRSLLIDILEKDED